MIWTISEHDRALGVVEFVRVMAGLVATTVRVQVAEAGRLDVPVSCGSCIAYPFAFSRIAR